MASETQPRPNISQRFENLEHGKTPTDVWEDLWKEEVTPWDRGTHNPALEDTLVQKTGILGNPTAPSPPTTGAEKETEGGGDVAGKRNSIERRKALVPGCGRGVDVFLLASFGYDAYGLEYSATALKACQREAAKYGENIKPRNKETGSGKVVFMQGNFFEDDWLRDVGLGAGAFDLIYDYTFFCALNPSFRPKWALRHSQLLAPSPRGNLICLEYPTLKDPALGGPPFASPPTAYMEHLSHPGEDVQYDGKGHVKSNPLREVSENGLERVAHWQPERTHEIGKDDDGNVMDWVSIWRRR